MLSGFFAFTTNSFLIRPSPAQKVMSPLSNAADMSHPSESHKHLDTRGTGKAQLRLHVFSRRGFIAKVVS